jgi:hypothetical protein
MKKKYILILILIQTISNVFAQSTTGFITDSTNVPFLARCGHDASTMLAAASRNTLGNRPSTFPPFAIIRCGKFDLYYDDLLPSSPPFGFADPTFGLDRINTLCAVMQYIQSTFNLSSVSSSNPIRINIKQSLSPANPSTSDWAAIASPGYINTGIPHIINGFIYDYVTTGVDPISTSQFHAQITVNFDQIVTPTSPPFVIIWQDNYSAPFINCKYDLFTVLLHEMGHAMGWFSLTNVTSPTALGSIISGNQYSGIDFTVHKGTIFPTSTLSKLILGSPTSPFINPAIATNTTNIINNDLWINNFSAPNNYPVYSGIYPFSLSNLSLGGVISHMDRQRFSYSSRERISPGDYQDFVMGPALSKGQLIRSFSKGEIKTFLQLGYNLNPAYASANPNIAINKTPFSTKMAGYTNFLNDNFPDAVLADFTFTNNIASSFTINLASDASLIDNDGDPISIYPNSLFNIRGCGMGGNNHNCLAISSNSRQIVYTPRPGFFGRAQFGFNLYDGKEKGGFTIYTIEVAKGTNNLNCVPGSNIVLNGGFEEGTEIKRLGAEESKPNDSFSYEFSREGRFRRGTIFGDNQRYNYSGINGLSSAPNAYGYLPVSNSWIACNGNTFTSDVWSPSFPSTSTLSVLAGGSQRFYDLHYGYYHNFDLCSNMSSCKTYSLEFDYYSTNLPFSGGGPVTFTVGFTNLSNITYNTMWPNPITCNYQFTITLNSLNASWQHVVIPFNYCSSVPSNILNISQGNVWTTFYIDNLSIKEKLTPALPLTVSVVTNTNNACAGTPINLTAITSNTLCSQSIVWQPGSLVGNSITVSPTSTTIYTTTVNDGCRTATVTATINVTPNPTITASASNYTVCTGQSSTLTATGGTSYTWQPSGSTSNPFVVSPTTPTTYTVSSNNICGISTKTISVTILPTLSLSISATNSVLCSGSSATLTATGAISYTCQPGGSTTNPFVVSPTTPTTYTVSSSNICGIRTKTISVTVVPPLLLNINASNSLLCAGNSSTLTATGATSYTWQPGGSTTNPFVVSPTTPTTYTVSSSNICGISTKTISINTTNIPLCCVPTNTTFGTSATSTVALSGTYSGLTININGVVTINANTSFNNCTLRMAPNSKIEVNPYTTLTFNSSKVFCCTNLWWGIELKKINNGSVSIAGNVQLLRSTVEDMYYGIFVDWVGMTASSGGNILVNQSLLNKNYASIQVLNCNMYQSATTKYPLSITQSTISSNPTVNSPLTTLKPSTSYPYAYTNVNGNGAPYVNFPRSYMGINIWSHNQSPVLIGDSLGANLTNTFDHVDIGIAISRSNVLVHNNEFKNLTGSTYLPYSTASAANEIGVGVKATAMVGKKLQVGTSASVPNTTTTFPKSNLFTNCNKGVLVIKSDNVVVKGNKFNCTATSVLPLNCFGCPSPLYNYLQGQSAVWLSGTQGKATISFNTCNNINNGIFVSHIVNAPTTSKIVVNNNAINAPLANGYCKQAITLEQLSTYTLTSNYISVANNTLSTVYNGIVVNSVKGGLTITNNPLISVERNKTFGLVGNVSSIASYTRTGIKLTNCFGATVANNPNINSVGTAAITAANYNKLIGVFYTNSFGGQVNCNTVSNTGQCFVFKAYCKNSWFANNMKTSYQGLVLSNNGFIGQQGAPTGTQNLSTNTWAGITNAETYVVSTPNVNTGATSSPLYVKANTSSTVRTTPILNLSAPAGQQYNISPSDGIRVTTGTVKTCGAATGGGGGGAVVVAMGDVMLGGSISTIGTLGGGVLLPQQRCDQLLAFYLTNPNYVFTSADIQDLQSMASQCVLAGDYVVQARCLLNVIFGYVLDFDDVCVSTSRMALADSDPLPAEPQHLAHFNLYPNPNNGTMQLDYELTSCENCQLVIYDVLGKVISTYKLTETIGTLQINETQLGQGVYFYSINQNEISIYKNKFSIFK